MWQAAFDYLDPYTKKLDFSDTVAALYILGVPNSTVYDIDSFGEVFMPHEGDPDLFPIGVVETIEK